MNLQRRSELFLESEGHMEQSRDENAAKENAARNLKKSEIESEERALNRALTEVNKNHGATFAGGNIGIWGLVNSDPGFTYPHLIDTLIEHFLLPYSVQTKEAIARALTCKEAKNTDAPDHFMRELKSLHSPMCYPDSSFRFAIINALNHIGDNRQVEGIRNLIEDERYADEREFLEKTLLKIQKRKYKHNRAVP